MSCEGKLSIGDVAEWLTQRPAKPFIRVRFSASPPLVFRALCVTYNLLTVHVLICSRSRSKGQFAADLLAHDPLVEIVGMFHEDEEIRQALRTVPFDICILGPTSVDKKFDLDPLAPGVNYPVRKYVMLNVSPTAERVVLAHQLGMHDVVDVSLHMVDMRERFEKVLSGEVDLTKISSIMGVIEWLRPTNVVHHAQDEMDIRILMELVEGRTNEEIAASVHLALQTVRNRVSRLMKAAGVSNRTQLATLMLR
ncbi:MAG: Bacterial regulatory protein luxR family [Actinomycetota bacterium]